MVTRRAKFYPELIPTLYEEKVAQSVRQKQMEKISRESLKLITHVNNDMKDKIGAVLKQGIEEGKSVAATASRLLTIGLDKGIFRSSRKRAWLIARTELHRARQMAAIDIYRANGIKVVKWVGIADGRLCDDCAKMEGRVFNLEKLVKSGKMPPVHPRCRCRVVPSGFELSIKVRHGKEGKVVETKIYPSKENYLYVVKLKKSLATEETKQKIINYFDNVTMEQLRKDLEDVGLQQGDDTYLTSPFQGDDDVVDLEKSDYSSTQVELPKPLASKVLGLLSLIDKEDLHPTEKQDDVPHITVRYGLHTNFPDEVIDILEGSKRVKASISGVDVFQPEEKDYDVLILRVDSPDLNAINKILAKLPNTSTQPFYQPHMTIAYLKRGLGDKYRNLVTGLEGESLEFDCVMFSSKDRDKTRIDLSKAETRVKLHQRVRRGKLETVRSYMKTIPQMASELVRDKKVTAEKYKVDPKNLVYSGLQSFEPMLSEYMHLWTVLDPSSPRHESTVTSNIHYATPIRKLRSGKLTEVDIRSKLKTGDVSGLQAKIIYRPVGSTEALISINDKKFVVDDQRRLTLLDIPIDFSKRKSAYPTKTEGEVSEYLKQFPKLGREDFADFRKLEPVGKESQVAEDSSQEDEEAINKIMEECKFSGVTYQSSHVPREVVLHAFLKQLEALRSKIVVDGRNSLRFFIKNLTVNEGGAVYFFHTDSIVMDDRYTSHLAHEYGHFIYGKNIGTDEEFSKFTLPGIGGIKSPVYITEDSLATMFNRWSERYTPMSFSDPSTKPKTEAQKAYKELIVRLGEFYSKEWEKVRGFSGFNLFDLEGNIISEKNKEDFSDWFEYVFDLNEVFARAIDTYVSGGKSLYSEIETGDYFNIVNEWGDKYLKTGIVKSLFDLEKARPYIRTKKGKLEHVKGYTSKTRLFDLSPEKRIDKALDESREDVKVVNRIVHEVNSVGGRALIIGGFVRDALLGKSSKDIDVEVYGVSPNELSSILSRVGKVDAVGASFGVLKVSTPELEESLDVSIPRRDSKIGEGHKGFQVEPDPSMTVEEAARRRDLTINAISYDPLTKEIVDPYGGAQDIKDKKLKAIDPNTFVEDPLRVLRVMQFAGRFEFSPDVDLIKLCRTVDLSSLPKERIYEEFEKLFLKSKMPSIGLRLVPALGIDKILPELESLRGVPQDPKYHPEGACARRILEK